MEKRRSFLVFLKQFLVVYKSWEPENYGQLSDAASTSIPLAEHSSHSDDVVIGCFAGHPAEFILTLTEEVKQVTALVTECKLKFESVVCQNALRLFFSLNGSAKQVTL